MDWLAGTYVRVVFAGNSDLRHLRQHQQRPFPVESRPGDYEMSEIKDCRPDTPYTKEQDGPGIRWRHHGAHEVGEQMDGWPSGDTVMYKCPNCGVMWEEELPQ